jgi:class 3 adenylate cyclase
MTRHVDMTEGAGLELPTALTADELATLAATTPERIQRLAEIGVLRPDDAGRFSPPDIQRVRIVLAYENGGIELEHIAQAIDEGLMSFEFTDRIYPQASPPSGRTVGDLASALGSRGEILPDLFMAMGLPRPDQDRALTQADVSIITRFVDAWDAETSTRDTWLRAARLLGEMARRAAEGWVDLFTETYSPPAQESASMSLDELETRVFVPAVRIAGLIEPMATWLLRRQMELALDGANVEAMEHALEVRGLKSPVQVDPPAMLFADMSGFTQLTEEGGDVLAVDYAATLSHLALNVTTTHRGRLVKQLGDGVMLAFTDRRAAIEAAVALRAAASETRLPALHVGISSGPVIERDGDYFGRTVNLASRLSGIAGPGEIVVDATTAEALEADDSVALGSVEVKGLPAAIPLFRLRS